MTTPEIEELKILLEEKYNKALTSTTDFDGFSLFVQKKTNQCVSPSTLKRLWGYVSDSHKPRTDTLDRLAKCLGHKNYSDFVKDLKTNTRYNSSFFAAEQLSSGDIADGCTIEIGWSPNRLVTLRYHGNSLYEVTRSQNSKMQEGDRFVTGCFIKGQPLYLPYIERTGGRTAPFVAGRNGGLTIIKVK